MKYVRVKENQKLARDIMSNAIVNTDNVEYTKYIEEREKRKNDANKFDNLEQQIIDLKSDIDEIKNLLRGLAK